MALPALALAVALALALALDLDLGLTFGPGLPFHGGPGNNYAMHSIAAMAQTLRANPGPSVRVRVRVRVRACKAGLSGMRFNEGGRDLRVRVRVRIRLRVTKP